MQTFKQDKNDLPARIEPDLKIRAENIFKAIGISHTDAIRLFYRQAVISKGIPFKLKIPNKMTLAAVKELENGKSIKRFPSVKKAFESLKI